MPPQFGYYAHGVGPETAILPRDWRSRLVAVHSEATQGVTGYCLHPSDLAARKLVAGREKDIRFVTAMLRHRLVALPEVEERAAALDSADYTRRVMDNLALCHSRL